MTHPQNSTSKHTQNTRLLWRGSLLNQTGYRLHGLAIVAHSINPKAISQPKHDPFSADSYSQTLNDTCLEIEMLRGRDLHVDKLIQLTLEPREQEMFLNQEDQMSSRKSRVASLLEGKGNGSNEPNRQVSFSEIDCDPEVRLYVDPRCSQTHDWILSQLGKRELNSAGFTHNAMIVRLDPAADDQISPQLVVFGRAVEPGEGDLAQPSTSDTVVPLQLIIGQHKPRRSRPIPRPDDPMPRVISSLSFTEPGKSAHQKSIGTGVNHSTRTSRGQTATASRVNSILARKKIDRTHLPTHDASNTIHTNLHRRHHNTTIKRPANTPGRRIKPGTSLPDEESEALTLFEACEYLSPRQSEKRKSINVSSFSAKKVKTAIKSTKRGHQLLNPYPPMEEAEREQETGGLDSENDFPVDRSPSPSPSPFRYPLQPTSALVPTPDQSQPPLVGSNEHQPNGLPPAPPEPTKSSRVRFLPPKKLISKLPNFPAAINPREKLSTDLAPETKVVSPSSYLHQNKLLIRKIASESLNNRGLHKHHSKFKDLFGAVCRGVQFALREALEKQSIDINLTRTFVESHLAMYMILNNSQTEVGN